MAESVTLGRIVHAHGSLFDPTVDGEEPDAWHAAIVVDVRALDLKPLQPSFRANVFRYGGEAQCFTFYLPGEGKDWRWPPRPERPLEIPRG